MAKLNWLHLTDLHLGMEGQAHLWPNVRDAFFDDLGELRQRCGPWDLVLFTGDFVQRGSAAELAELDTLLDQLWSRLAELGSEPVLLAVPGNHDLVRPDPKAATVLLLTRWAEFSDIHEPFWNDPLSEYRRTVTEVFVPYTKWWKPCPWRGDLPVRHGLLPGDFSATWEGDGLRVGIVGLNTTFLQLTGGDYHGRLAWDARQLHEACGDGAAWTREHDVSILLTHQGPDWLDETSRTQVYGEINPAGRFAVHLFGHMHENVVRGERFGGGRERRTWQGSSLFGLERFGEGGGVERRHGYSAGQISFNKSGAYLRHWPRQAVFDEVNGWRFVRDEASCVLNRDGGTRRERLSVTARAKRAKVSSAKRGRGRPSMDRLEIETRRAVEAYVEATQDFCDIIDLAGLPEDDRHLAMQKFLLRQLYVPLRVVVEAAVEDELEPEHLEELEKRRERQRLAAAGRGDREPPSRKPEPVGRRLGEAQRLVVLGDPGSGKTTLLRWLATAYLLRRRGDPDHASLPDVDTLPDADWIPILVRCRELDARELKTCSFEDILLQTLRKAEITEELRNLLTAELRRMLSAGEAILLIDGLDEIVDPTVRAAFCRQIEKIAEANKKAPIIATSRIVGYREMRYRLRHGFEHGTLSDLTNDDKAAFVRRWCEVTETRERRERAAEELITAIQSSDRIARLAGNPMLLTTLALVKRKVGKLPTRRARLYEYAVDVLLNWRSDVDLPLESEEALPQLEYVAYEMCRRGVQRLRRDEMLELLEGVRREYPHIRPVARREPEEFLARLEARTGVVVEVGEVRHSGQMVPVYEFRHLTFQEYLAGLALVEGRFPGHDKERSIGERVAPLAGVMGGERSRELEVTESWREPLRLCVACCNDDDVDEVMRAILKPAPGENPEETARPRAILAVLCLADEPNVSQELAEQVLVQFATKVGSADGMGFVNTGMDRAAMELAGSEWCKALGRALAIEFMQRGPETRQNPGGLYGMINAPKDAAEPGTVKSWLIDQVDHLVCDDVSAIEAALSVMHLAYRGRAQAVPNLISSLVDMADRGHAFSHAACWALGWLSSMSVWTLDAKEERWLADKIGDASVDPGALWWLMNIVTRYRIGSAEGFLKDWLNYDSARIRQAAAQALGSIQDSRAVDALINKLNDDDVGVRRAAISALGSFQDPRAMDALINKLSDDDASVRRGAMGCLAKTRSNEVDRKLLSEVFGLSEVWLDPQVRITESRVRAAAKAINISKREVRHRYEALADDFALTLAWQDRSVS